MRLVKAPLQSSPPVLAVSLIRKSSDVWAEDVWKSMYLPTSVTPSVLMLRIVGYVFPLLVAVGAL